MTHLTPGTEPPTATRFWRDTLGSARCGWWAASGSCA